MDCTLFYNAYSSRPKTSKEISMIINDLSKKKILLIGQSQELSQTLEKFETDNNVADLKDCIEHLENQKRFYSEHSELLNHSISLLKVSIGSIHTKIVCVDAHIKSLMSDIPEMKALRIRRSSELNFAQVSFLSMRIQLAYDKIPRLEEKKENLNECLIEYNLLVEKLTQKLLLINECINSIGDNITEKRNHLEYTEKQISHVKRNLSSIESEIRNIDVQIKIGSGLIQKNYTRYRMHQEQTYQAHLMRMARQKNEAVEHEDRRKQAAIQRMNSEEAELTKNIEETERKLEEYKKKLTEMRSRQRKFF